MALNSREASIETSIDGRYCRRHRLFLEVEARDSGPTCGTVTVYDISNTGLLIETDSILTIGETVEIQLPLVGFRTAEIVWTSGQLVGCKFIHALTQGVVSAARLGAVPIESSEASGAVSKQHAAISQLPEQEGGITSTEKFSLGDTLRVIIVLATLSWISLAMIAGALTW